MSKTVLWAIIGILSAASAGEGYYIYAQHQSKKPAVAQDLWAQQEQWLSEARKHMSQRAPVPLKQFDDLFNDDFFGHRFDPFREIEQFHKRMRSMLGETEQPLFNRSWDDWFENRMSVANIHSEVKTTDKEVILAFNIPGLNGESLNININNDRIRVSYDAKSVQDKKDEKGGSYFKSESVQHFEKVMPIPAQADPAKSRIVHEGDVVKIIFEKRQEKSLKT